MIRLQDFEADLFHLSKFSAEKDLIVEYYENDPEHRKTRWSLLQQLQQRQQSGGVVARLLQNDNFKSVYLADLSYLQNLLAIQRLPTYDRLTTILLVAIFKYLLIDPIYYLFAFASEQDILPLSKLILNMEDYCPIVWDAFRSPDTVIEDEDDEPWIIDQVNKHTGFTFSSFDSDYNYYRCAMLTGIIYRGNVELYRQILSQLEIPIGDFYLNKMVPTALESGSIEMSQEVISKLYNPHVAINFIPHAKNLEVVKYLLDLYDELVPPEGRKYTPKEIVYFLEEELAQPLYTKYLFDTRPRLGFLKQVLLVYASQYKVSLALLDKLRRLSESNPGLISRKKLEKFLDMTSGVTIPQDINYVQLDL